MSEKKYHVTTIGQVGACSATVRSCPYGGEDRHFDNPRDAHAAAMLQHGAPVKADAVFMERRRKSAQAARACVQIFLDSGSAGASEKQIASAIYEHLRERFGDDEQLISLSRVHMNGIVSERYNVALNESVQAEINALMSADSR